MVFQFADFSNQISAASALASFSPVENRWQVARLFQLEKIKPANPAAMTKVKLAKQS